MSKKNNKQKDKRYIQYLLREEKKRKERRDELQGRKEAKAMREEQKQISTERNKLARKPVVPPKIGSKVKLEKMLQRQMKTLSIGDKRKINMADSSSGEDEAMDVDQVVPKITQKKIKKKGGSMAQQKMMKKEIKRLKKTGHKKEARKLEKKRMVELEEAKEAA